MEDSEYELYEIRVKLLVKLLNAFAEEGDEKDGSVWLSALTHMMMVTLDACPEPEEYLDALILGFSEMRGKLDEGEK